MTPNYKKHKIKFGNSIYDVSVVAFDKDGLLFDTSALLVELSRLRMVAMQKYAEDAFILKWQKLLGVDAIIENGQPRVVSMAPDGAVYTASIHDEACITATFIMEHLGKNWVDAHDISLKVLNWADAHIDPLSAAKPKKGYPEIFQKLRKAGIPYGIVTLDVKQRAVDFVNVLDDATKLSFLISPSEVKEPKPAPDAILYIADQFQVPTSEIAVLGDLYVDLQMAKNAGSIAIGIPEYDEAKSLMMPYADEVLQSLDDIEIL